MIFLPYVKKQLTLYNSNFRNCKCILSNADNQIAIPFTQIIFIPKHGGGEIKKIIPLLAG
jgi:hypothetical protein